MKHIIGALVSLITLFASYAYAIPFGQDYLACDKFKKEIVQNHPKGQGYGCFAEVNGFGDGIKATDFVLSKRKDIPYSRLNLGWKDDHNFTDKDFVEIGKRSKRACPLTKKYPIKWYFSGATEHKLNADKANKLKKIVLDNCNSVTYVNNPLPQGAILPDTINEQHNGGKPRSAKCSFSYDGTAASDADNETDKKSFAQCEFFQIWSPRYNGRWQANDPTPRPQRKGWADANDIKAHAYLANVKGQAFLPNKYIWKPISENKGNGDPRAGKPVLIAPIKSSEYQLTKNGKKIASLRYYGTYQGGGFRYYSQEQGYQLGQKCGGSCDLVVNKKKVGTVDPGFRQNAYRR